MSTPLSYNVDGAAHAAGVSKRTIWRAIHDGELTTFKWGARTLIPAEDLNALIQRKRGERAA